MPNQSLPKHKIYKNGVNHESLRHSTVNSFKLVYERLSRLDRERKKKEKETYDNKDNEGEKRQRQRDGDGEEMMTSWLREIRISQ